jgi:lipopolysaccharide/colanic/teichoic acid biosynthesis glycosyltransferase
MSLVGPRPTSFTADTYDLWHTVRLGTTPGITGLWQIIGRGETEFDERLRLDIAYIERQCIALDFIILWKTIAMIIKPLHLKILVFLAYIRSIITNTRNTDSKA